jgi:hypothetical protein
MELPIGAITARAVQMATLKSPLPRIRPQRSVGCSLRRRSLSTTRCGSRSPRVRVRIQWDSSASRDTDSRTGFARSGAAAPAKLYSGRGHRACTCASARNLCKERRSWRSSRRPLRRSIAASEQLKGVIGAGADALKHQQARSRPSKASKRRPRQRSSRRPRLAGM